MQGKIALGKYRLLRVLGRGSNGEVYLAEPLVNPAHRVVVKLVHPHVLEHPKFEQLFEAEVKSMAKFSHPYAVQFIEAAYKDPLGPCLVMEYVPGITLEAVLEPARVLDVYRAGQLLGYFCHALQAAHDAGIIHRDLKPANLMVVDAGKPNETIKVMDFGFAGFAAKPHLQLAALTGEGPIVAMGTPAYVSPEMIRGDTVDWRSDLYSVGVILYEMLTGRLPFMDDNQDDLLDAHVNKPPPKFAKVGAGGVPPAIEATVQMALSKFPNERPQSAQELAQMYGRALSADLWGVTAPVGWESMPMAVEITPEPRVAPNLPLDPYKIIEEFEVLMPERLAAAKIKGFVDDLSGAVVGSEPGVICLQIGLPPGTKPKAPSDAVASGSGSGILNWFRRKPHVPPGQEPIQVELHLEKPDQSQARMNVKVVFSPLDEYMPTNPRVWRTRCDALFASLRRYL
ncbi:MAG: serine/threonine protein kinase [Planctomycetes bacterium]|nr:serine/threonine protein kinase [Planctomycetota bacterium]